MRSKIVIALSLLALPLSLVASHTAFGQDDAKPASQSMKEAGQSAEQAGNAAGAALQQAYEGTKTAVKDTAITARVKTALDKDRALGSSEIHVDTVASVVTLSGAVQNDGDSKRAQDVAQQTEGVKSVVNRLNVVTGQNVVN